MVKCFEKNEIFSKLKLRAFIMSGGSGKKPKEASNVALTAVALQDHWSRSISLGPKFGPKKIGLGPAARVKQKFEARSVIDTGRNAGKKKASEREKEKEKEKEYVLDQQPPPLTLAQKFGLVSAPKPLLSETEWSEVKEKSKKRDDSGEPCVICKEDFGLQEQVLLSCTHVFHRACLQAFERFTGRKTCPMCRREQYQTRVIHEGSRIHRHKCATKIQAAWRGYVVYSWYRNLRETIPPSDPMLRKKFYEEKLTSIVDRMVKSLDMNVAAFMTELDNNIKESRQIFDKWDAVHSTITDEEWEGIQLKAVQRGSEDCPICLTELCLVDDCLEKNKEKQVDFTGNVNSRMQESPQSGGIQQTSMPQGAKVHGQRDRRKAADKKLFEKLYIASKGENNLPEAARNKFIQSPDLNQGTKHDQDHLSKGANSAILKSAKPVQHKIRSTVLLSCSHVFHTTCLSTLEEMAMIDMRNTCPVCRAHYQKKVIVF